MGCIKPLSSFSKLIKELSDSTDDLPNPNPLRFEILETFEVNGYLVVKINYPDCTNFEGDKILVFVNTNLAELMLQESLDPHFTSESNLVARFIPTQKGWAAAVEFARRVLV